MCCATFHRWPNGSVSWPWRPPELVGDHLVDAGAAGDRPLPEGGSIVLIWNTVAVLPIERGERIPAFGNSLPAWTVESPVRSTTVINLPPDGATLASSRAPKAGNAIARAGHRDDRVQCFAARARANRGATKEPPGCPRSALKLTLAIAESGKPGRQLACIVVACDRIEAEDPRSIPRNSRQATHGRAAAFSPGIANGAVPESAS